MVPSRRSTPPSTRASIARCSASPGRTATASSLEGAVFSASNAVDGNLGTRWASQWNDAQWLQVDLGASKQLSRAVLTWEGAYGKSYEIQASDNGTDWRTVTAVSAGDGGTDEVALSGSGRYVRMNGLTRGTGYGYSLWEFQVYGEAGGTGPTMVWIPAGTFETLPGFKVEKLFTVPKDKLGSWVNITADDKGRLIASDQGNLGLVRITPGKVGTGEETKVERIPAKITAATPASLSGK